MKTLDSAALRELFLQFFEEKAHLRMPSSSLVPQNDPTLLFTTAGMVQMKPYFLGETTPPRVRMTSVQKSFRMTDVDSVGDPTHLTFFEMLGNFSVGDYFKREAIAFAWEFCTKRVELPADRLWATVFLDDDEAAAIWQETGVPAERIRRYGEEDNFWGPAGESGPCGPCSEIHYELRPGDPCERPDCGPACTCGRFVEIWNLVFMQYAQAVDGSRQPLASTNIDTGMGLERLAAILQGAASVYETDLFTPLIRRASELSGRSFGEDQETDRALRSMAEHARAAVFLITDGVTPANEGRGYVLRRLLRRGIRFGRRLGLEQNFLVDIAEDVFSVMGNAYPDLLVARPHIRATIAREEDRFRQTLAVGTTLLDEVMARAVGEGADRIDGDELFRLYDTYGFPFEMAEEVASDRGLGVDRASFDRAMAAQRERARSVGGFSRVGKIADGHRTLSSLSTKSIAHEATTADSSVIGLIVGGGVVVTASAAQQVEIVTTVSPFYAEAGGQIGDRGTITGPRGIARITDTQRPVPDSHDFIIHIGVVESGTIALGDPVRLAVDPAHRAETTRHHTATHLLHAALRQALGGHVRQAGSLVAADRLRFDFSHNSSLSEQELAAVTRVVNQRVLHNLAVRSREVPLREALASGALAFFGDKYGDTVRTVEIRGGGETDETPFSFELCGGTHVGATGEVGFIHVLSEASVGSGMRRVEAVAGTAADLLIADRLATLERVARRLRVAPAIVEERLVAHLEESERTRKRVESLEHDIVRTKIGSLVAKVDTIGGIAFLADQVDAPSVETLKGLADDLRTAIGSGVILLGSVIGGKPSFVCVVTPDLVGRGGRYHAGRIIREVTAAAGGGGGGRPEMATAGGGDVATMGQGMAAARAFVAG